MAKELKLDSEYFVTVFIQLSPVVQYIHFII